MAPPMRAWIIAGLALLATPAFATVATGAEKWRAGDWPGAIAEWTTPAARGDADALFNMGQAYRLGRGVALDIPTAIDYYRRAAAKGHVAATANLGITLWQDGRRTEALGHLRTAADRGDLRAAYVLGVATFTGDGAPRNPALGYAYIVRARDGGLAPASASAARFPTLLTADDRARGEAAAAALAAGRPVAVALAEVATVGRPEAVPEAGAAEPVATGPGAAPDDEDDSEATPPAEAPRPAKAARDPEGFRVQLGAYANERAARTAWATLVSQSATLLKGQKPVYSPRGGLIRLQIGPFEERAEARELCAKLSAAGRPCFVTR